MLYCVSVHFNMYCAVAKSPIDPAADFTANGDDSFGWKSPHDSH